MNEMTIEQKVQQFITELETRESIAIESVNSSV